MTNNDFKKLLDEAIKPLKQDINGIKEEQVELRKTIEERVLPPVAYIENTVKSYADRYVANEDNLGIQSPQELEIPKFD